VRQTLVMNRVGFGSHTKATKADCDIIMKSRLQPEEAGSEASGITKISQTWAGLTNLDTVLRDWFKLDQLRCSDHILDISVMTLERRR
jgi:hypothetical protein